jgi:uncharacterized protein YdeI (YjbR/CyaY-like superfamily)
VADEPASLTVPDAAAWRRWLREHHHEQAGVRLTLAKKGTTHPTTLTYDEALDEALCHGWIDGQLRRRDGATYSQRFTPRRARSAWSKNNVARVEVLTASGRMHQAGLDEVERARADGRFDVAYAGQADITVPDDLAAALRANPAAKSMFDVLTRQNRYAVLYRITTAKRPETRARRLEQLVSMLASGRTPHPQRRGAPQATVMHRQPGQPGPAG